MAVKARDDVTLSTVTDVASTARYYLMQASTAAAPSQPTAVPAPSPWVTSEPAYTEGSTNTLYTVDVTVFTDGTFDYTPVSKSSSYEAAKQAYNKAVAAGTAASAAQAQADAALAAAPEWVTDPNFSTGSDKPTGITINATGAPVTPPGPATTYGRLNGRGSYLNLTIRNYAKPTTYRLSADLIADSTATAKATIGFIVKSAAGNTSWPTIAGVLPADASTAWARISGDITIPAGSTNVRVFMQINSSGSTAVGWYVTNLSVKDITEAKTALDAAAAAKTAADNAQTSANAANTDAANALSVANLADAAAKGLIKATATDPGQQEGRIWLQLDSSGRVIAVKISNGTAWSTYTLMAGQIIVPGSIGTTLIADGGITTPKLNVTDAMNAKILNIGFADSQGRTILNGDRIRMWNSSGQVTIDLDATTGTATLVNANITGTLRTGATGNRVEISTSSDDQTERGTIAFFNSSADETPSSLSASTRYYGNGLSSKGIDVSVGGSSFFIGDDTVFSEKTLDMPLKVRRTDLQPEVERVVPYLSLDSPPTGGANYEGRRALASEGQYFMREYVYFNDAWHLENTQVALPLGSNTAAGFGGVPTVVRDRQNVALYGVAQSSSNWAVGWVVGTVPSGKDLLPAKDAYGLAASGGSLVRLKIATSGVITVDAIMTGSPANWIILDGINWLSNLRWPL
ncbi:hypothetical protein [Pseudoclavibacter sp. CFCC 11306]|uniref:hypothetical protein n=1 Tax=Pseudoclavibacter sp. CFCC 11306 TaxID=1564493 RepID=UPI0013016805|nr:hypothetical protein [Pseudoclavibacter sp. CFCC 11306]KAB1659021.1 hypothetical protein F8O09_05500 [Pseudoclavibacter sp. CFCC 11306]